VVGGNISYSLIGPYVDSHGSVPYTFENCPAGHYTLAYNSGGPEGMTLYEIEPSQSQDLDAGGSITFTLVFVGGGLME